MNQKGPNKETAASPQHLIDLSWIMPRVLAWGEKALRKATMRKRKLSKKKWRKTLFIRREK